MPRAKDPNPYSVHPGVLMTQAWVQTLPEKTGRSLEEWIRLVQDEGPSTEPERRDWLERSVGKGEETGDPQAYLKAAPGYVDAMFAGPKAALRPIYEALLDLGLAVGPDAKACPGETIVPLYRNHVFAQIKPTTKTRIDFGLALKDTPATGRLIDTGGYAKKDRITHRFAITTLAEIDDEVRRWLKKAYEMDA
jgi:hypothetical protein